MTKLTELTSIALGVVLLAAGCGVERQVPTTLLGSGKCRGPADARTCK